MPHNDDEANGTSFSLPSPVILLSIAAVTLAVLALVVSVLEGPRIQEAEVVSDQPATAETKNDSETTTPTKKAKPKPQPIKRGEVMVEVYNNSGITGLAGTTSSQARDAGWQVVGTDNWVGTIPASTVYFPKRLKREAKTLARDLGIERTFAAVEPMKFDRLTVILTADHAG